MSGSEPQITVSSLVPHGVVLLSRSHPDFGRGFKDGRVANYDALLPYTVVIRNDADQEVIGYSVIWYCHGADGLLKKQVRTAFNFTTLQPGTNLPPHSTRIVSLYSSLEAGGLQIDSATEVSLKRLVAFYSRQSAINISLDAALFTDGSAVGPDSGGWIARWKAELDAEKEVFTIAARTPEANVKEVLRGLAGPAIQIARELGGFKNSGQLPIIAEREASCSADFNACLKLMRGYFALSLLEEIETKNDYSAVDNIRRILKSKRYPNVQTKGTQKP